MPPILHFHYEFLPVLILAVDVVDTAAVVGRHAQLLLVEEGDVDDSFLALQQVVQEINEEVLADLLSEDALEAHVREWIDKSSHSYLEYSLNCLANIRFIWISGLFSCSFGFLVLLA